MDYAIGIEGIGMRHCTAAIADSAGVIKHACRLEGESISFHTTSLAYIESRLTRLINEVLRPFGGLSNNPSVVVCIGLTGVTFRYDRLISFPEFFESLGLPVKRLICTGDIETVFASHAMTNCGSAVLCHSGSTAYACAPSKDKTLHCRVGGWGPIIGDEGSGYWLGREALRAIAEEHDRRQHRSSILWDEVNSWLSHPTAAVMGHAWIIGSQYWRMAKDTVNNTRCKGEGFDERTAIYYFVHQMQQQGVLADQRTLEGMETWRQIASGVAIPLIQAFRKGDNAAATILAQGMGHLAAQHKRACEITEAETGQYVLSPLVLSGGVLKFNEDVRTLLVNEIANQSKRPYSVLHPGTPGVLRPVCGSLLFALADSSTGNLQLPPTSIVETVKTSSRQRTPFSRYLAHD